MLALLIIALLLSITAIIISIVKKSPKGESGKPGETGPPGEQGPKGDPGLPSTQFALRPVYLDNGDTTVKPGNFYVVNGGNVNLSDPTDQENGLLSVFVANGLTNINLPRSAPLVLNAGGKAMVIVNGPTYSILFNN